MSIEEFWNQAFIACLARTDVLNAKNEADKALDICLNKWKDYQYEWVHSSQLWKNQPVGSFPTKTSQKSEE